MDLRLSGRLILPLLCSFAFSINAISIRTSLGVLQASKNLTLDTGDILSIDGEVPTVLHGVKLFTINLVRENGDYDLHFDVRGGSVIAISNKVGELWSDEYQQLEDSPLVAGKSFSLKIIVKEKSFEIVVKGNNKFNKYTWEKRIGGPVTLSSLFLEKAFVTKEMGPILRRNLDALRTELEELKAKPHWGPTGSTGATGATGLRGATGVTGATGEQGPISASAVLGLSSTNQLAKETVGLIESLANAPVSATGSGSVASDPAAGTVAVGATAAALPGAVALGNVDSSPVAAPAVAASAPAAAPAVAASAPAAAPAVAASAPAAAPAVAASAIAAAKI